MKRNTRYTEIGAALVGASLLGLAVPAGSSGQCCQSSPGAPATATVVGAKQAAPAPAQGCCSQAMSAAQSSQQASETANPIAAHGTPVDWRRNLEQIRPGAGHILDLAAYFIAKLTESYEKLTFAEPVTKWSSWCGGNSKSGNAKPCAPNCCQKPASESSSKPDDKTKCCG